MDICYECGAQGPLEASIDTRPYLEGSGLKILVQQHVRTCQECGAETVGVSDIQGLHNRIAEDIIHSPNRLSGPEIRFLRKHIGWSGDDFARFFQVSPATVSRWEHGKQALGTQADLLLRVSAAKQDPIKDYNLLDTPLKKSTVSKLRVCETSSGRWSCRPRSPAVCV